MFNKQLTELWLFSETTHKAFTRSHGVEKIQQRESVDYCCYGNSWLAETDEQEDDYYYDHGWWSWNRQSKGQIDIKHIHIGSMKMMSAWRWRRPYRFLPFQNQYLIQLWTIFKTLSPLVRHFFALQSWISLLLCLPFYIYIINHYLLLIPD